MDRYTVSFIGHRRVENSREIAERLREIIINLLRTKDFVEFQVGRNGDFDILVASCIKQMQDLYGHENSAMTLVLPYPLANMEYYEEYYDSIVIPEEAELAHPKGAITKRNRWMVEHSDVLIAYVRREYGGAAMCLNMAEKMKIEIIRL